MWDLNEGKRKVDLLYSTGYVHRAHTPHTGGVALKKKPWSFQALELGSTLQMTVGMVFHVWCSMFDVRCRRVYMYRVGV